MHEKLEAAEQSLGIKLNYLRAADEYTCRVIDSANDAVKSKFLELGVLDRRDLPDLYAFGSIARREMGPASDFDYLLVANGPVPDPTVIRHCRVAAIHAIYSISSKPPGHSGLFGTMISGADLVNVIGLNQDTNDSLSRRLLVLQESISLGGTLEGYRELNRCILRRYLYDYDKDVSRVPRFLLNDMMRYWRTVAVDYQAKRWLEFRPDELPTQDMDGQSNIKWGLRYIKLRSSRKWAFASNIIALFMPKITNSPTTVDYLMDQFEMPALARIGQLSEYLRSDSAAADALSRVLRLANEFVGELTDPSWREAVARVTDPLSDQNPKEFIVSRDRTHDLQDALESLFFGLRTSAAGDEETLHRLSRKYFSF